MKKILLTIAGVVTMMSVNAQTFTTSADTIKATYSGGVLLLHNDITNITSSTTFKITWNVVSCNFPASWKTDTAFGICDNTNCQTNVNNQLTGGSTFSSLIDYLPNQPGDFHLQLDLSWPSAAAANGTYYTVVKLSDGKPTPYTKNIVFQVAKNGLGVTNVNRNNDNVVLYPNPAKNNLFLNYTGSEAIRTISVYNLIGKIVRTYTATSNNVQMDIDDIPSGVYSLRLSDAHGQVVATRRFTHQ
jgi:hypothetical protein